MTFDTNCGNQIRVLKDLNCVQSGEQTAIAVASDQLNTEIANFSLFSKRCHRHSFTPQSLLHYSSHM